MGLLGKFSTRFPLGYVCVCVRERERVCYDKVRDEGASCRGFQKTLLFMVPQSTHTNLLGIRKLGIRRIIKKHLLFIYSTFGKGAQQGFPIQGPFCP